MSNTTPPPAGMALALLQHRLGEEGLAYALAALVGITSKMGDKTPEILLDMSRVCLQSPWASNDDPDETIGLQVVGGLTSNKYPWQAVFNAHPGVNPWDVLRDAANRLETASKDGNLRVEQRHHAEDGTTISTNQDNRPSPN